MPRRESWSNDQHPKLLPIQLHKMKHITHDRVDRTRLDALNLFFLFIEEVVLYLYNFSLGK